MIRHGRPGLLKQVGALPIEPEPFTMNRLARQHGFSLIELVIVITIIGIIAAIAAPRYADAETGRRLQGAKNTILADIEFAKRRARATSTTHVIKFYPSDDMYVIAEGTEITRSSIRLTRNLDLDPFKVELSRTNLGANPVAVITAFGDVSPGFTLGVLKNGIEISVVVAGIGNPGLTVVDSLIASDIVDANATDGLIKAGLGE